MYDEYIRWQRSKFERSPAQSIDVVLRRPILDGKVLPLDIAKIAQALPKVIPVGRVVYDAYSRHTADWLLRARRQRPRRRTADQRDELAPPHSITSSARASSEIGTVRPSALAVVRLMTRSNFVGCSTGISAGFAPRRILST